MAEQNTEQKTEKETNDKQSKTQPEKAKTESLQPKMPDKTDKSGKVTEKLPNEKSEKNAEKTANINSKTEPKKTTREPRPPTGIKKEKKPQYMVGDKSAGKAENSATKPTPATTQKSPQPDKAPEPSPPRDATRIGNAEQITYIAITDLHPFKGHPFQVRNDSAMMSLVESVKERGVDQPALVRPRENGGYELVAGHRRQHASELAGYKNVPCIVRKMSDDEAILAMTESNFNQRAEILPSERAQALKMQLDAIKRQGSRFKGIASGDVGKRSNEIVADRNKMSVKSIQRYIALTKLVPDMIKLVDEKRIPFTPAVEMSYIKPKNQNYIAVAIESNESAPSLTQAQRMRELDQKGILNGDVIDGIMLEEKKEEIKVILNSQELGKFFGPEKTPREMKNIILNLLDEWKEKNPQEHVKPVKAQEQEK